MVEQLYNNLFLVARNYEMAGSSSEKKVQADLLVEIFIEQQEQLLKIAQQVSRNFSHPDVKKYNFLEYHSIIGLHEQMGDGKWDLLCVTILTFQQVMLDILNQYPVPVWVENEQSYHIFTVNRDEVMDLFGLQLILFYFKARYLTQSLCIDFEFNNQKIALMQLNFEYHADNSYVFLLDPREIPRHIKNTFIQHILTNKYIPKVLHGSESMDIPYLYQEFFENREQIIQFTRSMIDTRFLCEYYKISHGERKICSIYPILLSMGVITEDQFQKLKTNHDKMGKIWKIKWNVHTLTGELVTYAAYDVILLQELVDKIKEVTNNDPEYQYLIPQLTQFVYLEKQGITHLMRSEKLELDPMNPYYVKDDGRKTLVDIYYEVVEQVEIMRKLLQIDYFKGFLSLIFKRIIYWKVTNSKQVWINKKTKYDGDLELNNYLAFFQKMKFGQIHDLVLNLSESI